MGGSVGNKELGLVRPVYYESRPDLWCDLPLSILLLVGWRHIVLAYIL